MLKCLMKYEWVKLRRDTLPAGKGIMGAWAKLAARAAFRKGHASYCGHKNAVSPGMWSGGIVGLKSILGIKSRTQALEILDKLAAFGYQSVQLDQLHAFEVPELAELDSRRDPLSVKQHLQPFSAVKATVVIQRSEANIHSTDYIIINQYTLFFHPYPPREIGKAE